MTAENLIILILLFFAYAFIGCCVTAPSSTAVLRRLNTERKQG